MERFREALASGRKTATTRSKRYVRPGERFVGLGMEFECLRTVQLPLAVIRDGYWEEEGVSSPEDFVKIWNGIHPRRGFVGTDVRWLHTFRKSDWEWKNPSYGKQVVRR